MILAEGAAVCLPHHCTVESGRVPLLEPLVPNPGLQACIESLVGVCWGQGGGDDEETRRRWGPLERRGLG